jgi:hypothetical protein
MDPDQRLTTSQPPRDLGVRLSDVPDGWSECLMSARIKHLVLSTPGYPQPVRHPRRKMCVIREAPGKGLGVFALEPIEKGDLIFAERPIIVCPSLLGTLVRSDATPEMAIASYLAQSEAIVESLLLRQAPEKVKAYMELTNCHETDGSGPKYGIMRTNGLGLSHLKEPHKRDKDVIIHYAGVGEVLSRVNHRLDLRSFSYARTI